MNVPLFSTPVSIHGMQVANRFVMAPMSVRYAAPNGEVTEKLISYYEARAAGGAGLIIVEASCVELAGKNGPNGLAVYDDSHISGLSKLVRRVKKHGTKIALQLVHRGRCASSLVTGQPVKLVSYVPGFCPESGCVMQESEIESVIDSYGAAARRAREAGFDAVELHGAHGYLINQFLSPLTNRRTDNYGGTPEKRMHFALRVLERVKAFAGEDFPVIFRMDSLEGYPGGLTIEDTMPIAKALVDAGVDALHVSAGIYESGLDVPSAYTPRAWNVDNAAAVRKAVDARVPVIAVGRICTPEVAENVLEEHKADMIALGREMLADPQFVNKALSGRSAEIIPCIACNEGCIGRTAKNLEAQCALNPSTGMEHLAVSAPASPVDESVWVIGGGPAGMEAALTAARLGRKVTLWEKNPELGGLLNLADNPPDKQELSRIVSSYAARLAACGVDVRTGVEVTADDVIKAAPDHVFVATGSVPVMPRFCASIPGAVPAEEVLSAPSFNFSNALVLGGGLIGCETAHLLAENGVHVTILEMKPELASDMQARARTILLQKLKELGVTVMTEREVVGPGENGSILIRNRFGGQETLTGFDKVVVAVGYRPRQNLSADLAAGGVTFHDMGDCRKVGKIMDAVHQARKTVQSVL